MARKTKAVYGWCLKTGEYKEYSSVYKAAMGTFGVYNGDKHKIINRSIKSPVEHKAAAGNIVWFEKKEGEAIVGKGAIIPAVWGRCLLTREIKQKADEAVLRPVIASDDNGNEYYFASVTEAADNLYGNVSNISRCLTNRTKGNSNHHSGKARLTAYGYYWRYANPKIVSS